MERLTRGITPVGMCKTNLDSMKHWMPCVPCREKAQIKTDSKGKKYTEKFSFCDTCEVKMLFNKLKGYEDAEEQGLLLRLPCKVGDIVFDNDFKEVYPYRITGFSFGIAEDYIDDPVKEDEIVYYCINSTGSITGSFASSEIGKTVFLTKEEAEQALEAMKGGA